MLLTTFLQEIYGLFGVVKLINGPNLVVISGRKRTGVILGHTIWQVTKFEVVPYRKSVLNLNQSQVILRDTKFICNWNCWRSYLTWSYNYRKKTWKPTHQCWMKVFRQNHSITQQHLISHTLCKELKLQMKTFSKSHCVQEQNRGKENIVAQW